MSDLRDEDEQVNTAAPWIRPQTLLLTFCGAHMPAGQAVYSGSLVDILQRVGVGEHATRSTLLRMSRRGLLVSHRVGKRVYFEVSARAATMLKEASERVWRQGAVNRGWDGNWTLLGFSLPESRRADRHLLRSRLTWAGFGLLQNGLWISPHAVDPRTLLEGLDVVGHIKAFRAKTLEGINVDEMIADAWDLETIAERYRGFLSRWEQPDPVPAAPDKLARQLLLLSEWLLLVREDPRLPVEHLPTDWPSVRAERVALRLRNAYQRPAREIVERQVERIEV